MQKWLLLSVSVALLASACAYPVSQAHYGRPSVQTIEFFDAAGRHTDYGKVQGGTIDLFNVDGSRAGYGTIKR